VFKAKHSIASGWRRDSCVTTPVTTYKNVCPPHSYAMLCYAMLCYAMLCYAMLCYAMLCYALRGEPRGAPRLLRRRVP
jgi:hypothetical protein